MKPLIYSPTWASRPLLVKARDWLLARESPFMADKLNFNQQKSPLCFRQRANNKTTYGGGIVMESLYDVNSELVKLEHEILHYEICIDRCKYKFYLKILRHGHKKLLEERKKLIGRHAKNKQEIKSGTLSNS